MAALYPMTRSAFLLFAHEMNWFDRRLAQQLARAVAGWADLYVLRYADAADSRTEAAHETGFGIPRITYGRRAMLNLPYPAKTAGEDWALMPGNCDLPVLAFAQQHPQCQHIWVAEFDVRFSGNWRVLFDALAESDADLLCTTLHDVAVNPGWYHWEGLQTPAQLERDVRRLRGFFPFYRVSARALATIDAAYRAGWGGHHEVAWPSILHDAGLKIEDIGGQGAFVPLVRRGRFYRNTPEDEFMMPGTFRYRPAMLMSPPALLGEGELFHPVKTADKLQRARRKIGRLLGLTPARTAPGE